MKREAEFDDIRPFYDEEVGPKIKELLADPEFKRVVEYIRPDIVWDDFKTLMLTYKNKHDFQFSIIKDTVFAVTAKSSASLSFSGVENVSPTKAYTYISNHRDIVLDASILCVLLAENGFDTVEIAIGDNLLIQPWISNLVRLNKSFIVKRGISSRQMLEASLHLSKYIHYTIQEKNQSVWIAQREGRAKNSNDKTQESVLKMLSLGGGKDFRESIRKTDIAPLSLSYEYDPCDYLKAKEFQLKRDNPDYKKSPQDDLINMETGLVGFKGNIHFRIGRPINPQLDRISSDLSKSELITAVAHMIDREIYLNYKFYPVNYIAYDRLWGNRKFEASYTKEDIDNFDIYIRNQLDKIDLENKDLPFLTEKLLEMYAYPVRNNLLAQLQ